MKDPEIYLTYNLTDSPFIAKLNEPIVYLSDIETLMKKPAIVGEDGRREFVFEKSGIQDRQPWKFTAWLDKKKRISSFQLPSRMSKILGNKFIIEGMRSIGYAEVSIGKKRIYLMVSSDFLKSQILELMGAPNQATPEKLSYLFDEEKTPMKVDIHVEGDQVKKVFLESNGFSLDARFDKEFVRE